MSSPGGGGGMGFLGLVFAICVALLIMFVL